MSMLRLFLAGDVMTGRGIDQVLAQPSDPRLFEPYVRDAREYVELAVRSSGNIPRPADPSYPWGAALEALEGARPDVRIVNLETSVTTSDAYWPGKGIHYRMHPANVACLTVAGLDCCVLANNHVLDFGRDGLLETLRTLHGAGLGTAGAAENASRAGAPCGIRVPDKGRVLVFAFGSETSGIPYEWAADDDSPGVNLLDDLTSATASRIGRAISRQRMAGDVVVASVHWGGNWGYRIPDAQRAFAHALVDAGGADIVHGHSSHHAKGIEIHRGKPVIYGCGDLLTDYEGIAGYEQYRGDLSLMYFVDLDVENREVVELTVVPLHLERFSLHRAAAADVGWIRDMLTREGAALDTRAEPLPDGRLAVRWS